MKFPLKFFLFLAVYSIFLTTGIAETTSPTPKNPSCMGMGAMHKSMMGNMTEEQKEKRLQARQEHMLKMHQLSNEILATTDPEKKDQLKKQQLVLMKEKMAKKRAHMAKMMKNCEMNGAKSGQMMKQ